MTVNKRTIIKVAISLACLSLLPVFVSVDKITELIQQLSLFPVLAALVLIFASILLSSIRFHGMMVSFKAFAPLASAHRINILSQIVGLFAFQTLGQMVFRSTYGGYFVSNPQRLAALTLLEKVVAFSTLMIISASGSFYITRNIEIGGREGLAILITLLAILMSVVSVYGFALTPGQRRFGRKVGAFLRRAGMERAAFISVLMHAMMLLAYTIIAHDFIPETSWAMTTAIFSVVMLGAALPISFAGWGVRELSAGFIFSYLGLDPSIGVLASALIGVVGLLALAGHGIIINFIKSTQAQALPNPAGQIEETHLEGALAFFSGIAIAVLVGFQVRIPTGSGELTVNLADPVAFLAAISFLIIWYRGYLHHAVWRINGLAPAMVLFAVMIVYGWTYGYVHYGVIDWASFNRGLGFLVLLAYLFSGSMVTAFFGRSAIRLIVRAILITTLCILALYVLAISFVDQETISKLQWRSFLFNGLIGNRNALAFVLTLILSTALAIKEPILGRWRPTAISLICFLLLLCGSRTGMITAGLVAAVAIYFRYFSAKEFVQALIATAALTILHFLLSYFITILLPQLLFDLVDLLQKLYFGLVDLLLELYYGLVYLLQELIYAFGAGGNADADVPQRAHVPERVSAPKRTYVPEKIPTSVFRGMDADLLSRMHVDRVASYKLGLEMWLENPVFGAGMGAFSLKYMNEFRFPLTIHNSGLWILAEMGLAGLVLFLSLPLAILAHIRRKYCRKFQWDDFALLLCLVSTGVFSQAHDILYQRILWFMLGLLVANKIRISDTLTRRGEAIH